MTSHLYVMQAVTGLIKIGRSIHPEKRRRALEQSSGHAVRLLLVLENRGDEERLVHAALAEHRTIGEWFNDTIACRAAICEVVGRNKIRWLYGAGSNLAKARAVRIANIKQRRADITTQAFTDMIARIDREGQLKRRQTTDNTDVVAALVM